MPKIHGRVIETRGSILVIRQGISTVETTHECPSHGASPGDYVLIDEDGLVEITRVPEPENIEVPGSGKTLADLQGPQQDHS